MQFVTEEQKRSFYASPDWAGANGLRNVALKRDNYECQLCKQNGEVHLDSVKVDGERKRIELNVHHIKEIETHPELALVLDNLQTICLEHHNIVHNRFQKKFNKWEHDERFD